MYLVSIASFLCLHKVRFDFLCLYQFCIWSAKMIYIDDDDDDDDDDSDEDDWHKHLLFD